MTDLRAKELTEIGDRLRSKRRPLMSLFQEIAEIFYPIRADFTTTIQLGNNYADGLSDSYPMLARQELGNTFSTLLRPAQTDWFMPTTGDEDKDADTAIGQGLQYVGGVIKRAMYDPHARFMRATKEGDHDYATFGQCVISVEESQALDHLLYRNWHIRDCVWMDDEDGQTNYMDREFKVTVRNYLRRWRDKAPSAVLAMENKSPDQEIKVRHLVMPSDEYDLSKGKKRKPKHPFVSIYYDCEHNVMLKETSMPRFSYIVPRWQTVSQSQYSYSPATTIALPDARMLQAVASLIQEMGEYAVSPAMIATEDAIRSDVNIFPNGITWVSETYDERQGEALRSLNRNADFNIGVELKQDARDMIAQAFSLNKLQLPPSENGDMTAYEVGQRVQEYIRAALPLFEPVEVEYNMPLVETTYEMLAERDAFDLDRIPAEMKGGDFSFRFLSPLREAEARKRTTQFTEVIGLIGALGPDAAMKKLPSTLLLDKALKEAIRGTGAPADWIPTEEQTASVQEEQGVEAANQNAMAQLTQGSEAAVNIADVTQKLAAAGQL
jgi:hypothetical protein